MVDWTITAATIYCDAIENEVTLMINSDGTSRCTGYNKYYQPSRESAISLKTRGKRLGKILKCEGLGCRRVVQYRDGLFSGKDRPSERNADRE